MVALFEIFPRVKQNVFVCRPKFECRLPDVFIELQRRGLARNSGFIETVEFGQRAKFKCVQIGQAQFMVQVMFGCIGVIEAN